MTDQTPTSAAVLPPSPQEKDRLIALLEDVDAFLATVEWNDTTSETDAANLQCEIQACLGAAVLPPSPQEKRLFQCRADLVKFTKEIRAYTDLTDAVDAVVDLTRWVDEALALPRPPQEQPTKEELIASMTNERLFQGWIDEAFGRCQRILGIEVAGDDPADFPACMKAVEEKFAARRPNGDK